MTNDIRFISQGPDEPRVILGTWGNLIEQHEYTHLKASVAYVSESGLRRLQNLLRGSQGEDVLQEWLVSIDFGRTEPEALRWLLEHEGSEVRIPHGNEILTRTSLRPSVVFHPKTILLDCAGTRVPFSIMAGSANLTASATTTPWPWSPQACR